MKTIVTAFKKINRAAAGFELFILCFVGVSLCFGQSLSADTAERKPVDSILSLQQQVSKAKPGDIIELKDGTYSEELILTGKGTAEEPIQIRAENIGGVEIVNKVTIQGDYLSLVGFRFSGKGEIRIQHSKGCRVSRCRMTNLNAGKWLVVDISSRNIELDHTLFEKKENNRILGKGCQMVQFILSNTNESHYIHHNYFRDIPKGKKGNGFETLQLITKGNPKDPKGGDTGNRIEYNLFERCDGEAEIISVKSNGNLIKGNTFLDCHGELVLRQGHRNVVDGNWFLNGKGGVRLQGRDQVVVNNYFEGLSSGLRMMNGIGEGKKVMYVRVENALIANNTFINCEQTFRIGMNHSKFPPGVVPKKCIIANNIFYQGSDRPAIAGLNGTRLQAFQGRPGETDLPGNVTKLQESGKETVITLQDGKEPEDWTWRNNLFQGVPGIPPRDGIKVGSAHLKTNEQGVALPTDKTPTGEKVETKTYSVEDDLLGTERKSPTTLGAIQYPARLPIDRITAKLVGPHFELEGNDSE